MSKVVFFCFHAFHGEQLRTRGLGGIASGTIMLSEALRDLGYEVEVFNSIKKPKEYEGIKYTPMHKAQKMDVAMAVSNNSARPLRLIQSGSKAVWQRNRTSLSRIWKRKELAQLFTVRPDLVALSDDALEKTPRYIPYRQRHVIPHAIEPAFLQLDATKFSDRPMRAFFASRPTRNLKWVIECWKEYVHKALPEAELHVCSPAGTKFPFDIDDLKRHNIIYRGSLQKPELAELMHSSRLLPYPGHINETGCQVALQAIGMGVPIVSFGEGSLRDLVLHEQNGYIEKEKAAYANRMIQCLSDEDTWQHLHNGAVNHPWRKSYADRALDWERIFIKN